MEGGISAGQDPVSGCRYEEDLRAKDAATPRSGGEHDPRCSPIKESSFSLDADPESAHLRRRARSDTRPLAGPSQLRRTSTISKRDGASRQPPLSRARDRVAEVDGDRCVLRRLQGAPSHSRLHTLNASHSEALRAPSRLGPGSTNRSTIVWRGYALPSFV